jgi:hypothetical protein
VTAPDPTRTLAGRAVAARVLSDAIKVVAEDARAALEPDMRPRDRIVAELADGTPIGAVERTRAAKRAVVTDEAALLAWVKTHAPTEVVESVRPAYVERLKADAKRDGRYAVLPDGEIVPGVEVVEGTPSFRVAPEDAEARALVLRLFLGRDNLLGIEAPRG